MRISTAALLFVALVTMAHAAPAAADTHDGIGWVLLSYSGGTGRSVAQLEPFPHGTAAVGIDFRGSATYGNLRGAMFAAESEVVVWPVEVGRDGQSDFPLILQLSIPANQNGHLLFWGAGGLAAFAWSVDLAPGAALSVIGTGDVATFIDTDQPRIGIHAHASAEGITASASAASLAHEVTNTFTGFAGARMHPVPEAAIEDEIRVHHPDGTFARCPCSAPDVLSVKDWTTGTYTITWEGVSVQSSSTILLAGVDVPGLLPLPRR